MITVGADPEAFIVHHSKRTPVPAHKLGLPFKMMPVNMIDGKVLRDGYALELNPDFSDCRYLMTGNFWNLLKQVNEQYLDGQRIITQSAMPINLATLEDAPEDVSEFGCEGAWNAYDQTVHKPAINGPTHPLRYTGGHLHCAHSAGTKVPWATKLDNVFLWAKLEDRYVGLISTYLTGSEWSGLRRKYYGLAGEFRVQEHPGTVAALEYRTPGSEIWSHPALTSLCLGLFRHIYENFASFAEVYSPTYEKQVQKAINTGVSHSDLLDLIPELKGWYTRKLLRKARPFFQTAMHRNLVPQIEHWLVKSWSGYGWREWCKNVGYTHYREHYQTDEDVVYADEVNNSKWGEEAA